MELCFGSGKSELVCYTDSNLGGNLDNSKSTSACLITFEGGAISWQSRLQKFITLSTTEAEYIAIIEGGQALEKTYVELYTLLNRISQGNPQWNGSGLKSVVQKIADPNPKLVNSVSTRSKTQLEELVPKKNTTEIVRKEGKLKVAYPEENEVVAPTEKLQPIVRPPPPFSQKLKKQSKDQCFGKFLSLLKQVHIYLPLVDVFQGIPRYAKYMKEIVVNKRRLTEYETITLTKECNSRIQNMLSIKLKDPGSFTMQITIGYSIHAQRLCDLGASISLMPISLFKKLGLGSPNPTTIILQLADRSVARLDGVVEDVLLQVGSLIYPVDKDQTRKDMKK
ncbi:uncharacterized protein [Solanum lycopersicum]|uniref:uncharacterized protein n=1 Tax=Solanum lycopersicum TaxID=4081 RepID=UPI003749AC1A